MIIEFDKKTGILNVNGPIDNKILSYGMLDMAKDIIQSVTPKAVKPVENKIIEVKKILSN
jgi:hypothetical protein